MHLNVLICTTVHFMHAHCPRKQSRIPPGGWRYSRSLVKVVETWGGNVAAYQSLPPKPIYHVAPPLITATKHIGLVPLGRTITSPLVALATEKYHNAHFMEVILILEAFNVKFRLVYSIVKALPAVLGSCERGRGGGSNFCPR